MNLVWTVGSRIHIELFETFRHKQYETGGAWPVEMHIR